MNSRDWYIPTDKFVKDRKSWQCCICLHVHCNQNVKIGCGHRFGKGCIDKLESKVCPLCREPFETYTIDDALNHQIMNETVRCPYADDCPWKGPTFKLLRKHRLECEFGEVQCTIRGCNHMCSRKKLSSHSKDTSWHAKYFQRKWIATLEENKKLKQEVVVLKNEVEAWKVNAGVEGSEDSEESFDFSQLPSTPRSFDFSPRRYSRSRSRSFERHFRHMYGRTRNARDRRSPSYDRSSDFSF